MDELQELLARLENPGDNPLTDEELADLEARLRARARELADEDSDEALEELTSIGAAVDQVRAEAQTRTDAAEARAARREELLTSINGEGEGDEGEGDNESGSEGDGETDSEGGDGGEQSTGDTGDGSGTGDGEPGTGADDQPQSQAASAGNRRGTSRPRIRDAAARGSRRHAPAPEPEDRPRATIVAGAGAPRHQTGTELTLDEVQENLSRAWHNESRVRGVKGVRRTIVATVQQPISPADRLTENDATGNSQRIESLAAAARRLPMRAITEAGSVQAATAQAITAAGGTCAPIPTTYDLGDNISTADRPLRDADVTLPAPRGGVRRLYAPQLADVDGMAYVWSYANDVNPNFADTDGPDVPVDERLAEKPCIRIDCPDGDTVMADAIPLCLRTGNFNRMTFPELFARWWELGQSAHARLAENKHFAKQIAGSPGQHTASQMLGASIDVLTAIDRVIAAERYRFRMDENTPIRFKAPAWVRDLIRVDRTRRARTDDDLNLSNEQINAWFTARNVNPTWLPDANQPIGLDAGDDAQLWPNSFTAVLHHEGAWAHIDAGELDLGTEIRTGEAIRVNDVMAFMETFEQTFFIGVWSDAVTFDVCPDGTASAAIDPAGLGLCVSGS